ncbi:MAG: LysR family transcriptional regulator [Ramlibacter sp.]|nr:LysR family transcriptional regulator [Ramlibacter sp.]
MGSVICIKKQRTPISICCQSLRFFGRGRQATLGDPGIATSLILLKMPAAGDYIFVIRSSVSGRSARPNLAAMSLAFSGAPLIPDALGGQLSLVHAAMNAHCRNGAIHLNLAGIDFVSLRLVVHCAELGSLSAAARRGNMSLSSASHRLSNIEEFFGNRFFERDYRGLRLTAAGAVFVGHATSILQALRLMGSQLASMRACDQIADVRHHDIRTSSEGLRRSEYQVSRTV